MKSRSFNYQNTPAIYFQNNIAVKPLNTFSGNSINKFNNSIVMYKEKISEQKLLYYVFDLFDTNTDVNLVMQKIVDILPSCSVFSNDVSVKLTFDNAEFSSVNIFQSNFYLSSLFKTFSEKNGKIEVFYKNEEAIKYFSPIFIESQMLLEGISKMLVSWINRFETERELEKMLVQLEMKIENRTEQLKKANEKLTDINKDINDSINYANRIQRAVLPTHEIINQVFKEAFVFYKPKDIISGDFYWLHKAGDKIFFACADCTGHGVPGALMSMVGHQLLDHIITDREITEPELILEEMDSAIIKLFKKSQLSDHLRDGMAMSLCVIDVKNGKLSFAGAYNNAYMFINKEMVILEANRQSIGGNEVEGGKKFTKIITDYSEGDLLYMFTDGLPDQFGGQKGKKLMRKNLLELINQNKKENMELQGEIYEYAFDKWKGSNFQVDDVTLLGVKL